MNSDQQWDRILQRASEQRSAGPSLGECLDPETLAAWSDGSLDGSQREAAETHVADCARCLATVAALAKTPQPVAAPAARSSWLSIRWLVPLTTAAAAIMAWVFVQDPGHSPAPAPGVSPAIESAVRDDAAPPLKAEQGATARSDAAKKTQAAPSSAPAEGRAAARPPAPPELGADAAAKETAPPRQTTALQERPAPPPAASPPARREAFNDAAAPVARRLGATASMIVSPDSSVRWRITGLSVERSTDGGRNWRLQATGTAVELLAGSAPARDVCWIVGRAGTVLLSAGGDTWRRLDFPDATVDLVAVTARDGAEATVTAADGRTYRTADGGRSWTLQETPAAPF